MTNIERTAVTALLVALVVFAALSKVSARNDRLAEPLSTEQIASAVPSGEVLKYVALGHNEAMADLVWLNALSFYSAYASTGMDDHWLDPHVEAIMTLDPEFRLVFEWAGTVIMYAGEIDNDSVMAANRFLEIGVERFPFDWSLRFMLGVNYYFEMVPTNAEEAENVEDWRTTGAEHLAIAAGLPNAPSNLRLAAASFLRRRASWSRQTQNYRENFLSVRSIEARTMRRHVETTMPADEAELWLRRRTLTTEALPSQTQWGFPPYDVGLVLHPDPMRLFTPEQLTPPPFSQTQ